MRGLDGPARAHFDRRLSRGSHRPLAVALSGGGDSLALLLIADAWAREVGRQLLVLTVDHGLSPASGAWTTACARTAERLGRPFRALAWTGDKPARGLPAAARAARHRLLATAAREAGASVVLMGHTADDVLEARRMREAGATTPEPRAWGPSPAWPEGRGIFLLRPLLDIRRAELRRWLAVRDQGWIDDPANADPLYARSRARPLAALDSAPVLSEPVPLDLDFEDRFGVLRFPRGSLRADGARLLALACVCAGGGDRRPARDRIARMAEALRGAAPLIGGLAGARVEADADAVWIFREPGEAARGGLAPLPLVEGSPAVWDGRFEVLAHTPGLVMRRLAGLQARLPARERVALTALPPKARGALPAAVVREAASCPLLSPGPQLEVRSLVGERLRAAAGLIVREPD